MWTQILSGQLVNKSFFLTFLMFLPLFTAFIGAIVSKTTDISYLDNYCNVLMDLLNLAFIPLQSFLKLGALKHI